MNAFLENIDRFIVDNELMDRNRLYLTALSGGADSVALTLALKELGYNVEAVHCNFHLRGEESCRDEEFCISFCKTNGIKFHIVHFDTREYATIHKVSIEMAARELRYGYFARLREDIGAEGICVGHHREDSVETLLINLIRGTGINGMTGIAPKNGYILRPMLDVSRSDIETFLKGCGQQFVTDSTNLIDDATRNKIRLNIMPLIRSINPSADKDIAATARRLAETAKVFNNAIATEAGSVTVTEDNKTIIDTKKLATTTSPEYTLYNILSRFNFSPATIENIHSRLQNQPQTGKIFSSANHRLLLDRGFMIIEEAGNERGIKMKIPEYGTYVINEEKKFRFARVNTSDKDFHISKDSRVATLDASRITFPLTVRTTATGDWFVPFGMNGRKLVSDYLTDQKMNLFEKERQLVIENANGEIIWITGHRTDNRFRVTSDTQEALVIEVKES